jgi:GDP-L-fucose synthase
MFYKNKNILVAGGAGFVGSNLIKKLLELDANVTATINTSKPIIIDERITYLRCDLRNQNDCKLAVNKMDYVFMCAANSSGAAIIEKTPLVHLTPNMIMNMQILEAAYEERVKKFLFISSNTVYPDADYAVKEEDVINEFFEKYYIVGWMKRFSEIVCDMYSTKITNPMQTIIVRPGNLYGINDKFDWEKSKVIPALIRKAVERLDPYEVWGDGLDIKDFLYIDDFVEGLLLSMEKLNEFSIVNIASGKQVIIKEILEIILRICNYEDANVVFNTAMPTMIPKRLIDISKARELLGFSPSVNVEEGIKRTVDWYQKKDHKLQ